MFYRRRDPLEGSALPTVGVGLSILRVATGFVFFMHGYQKLVTDGIDDTEQFFSRVGAPLPEYTASLVAYAELIGGVMLLIGMLTQLVAAVLFIDMAAAFFIVHFENGFFVTENGYELVFLLGGAALAVMLTGPGSYSVDNALPGTRVGRRR